MNAPPSLQAIADRLQGYDPQALAAPHVNAFLDALVTPVSESERVSTLQALDRILAEDVVSPISVPPHDNSAALPWAAARCVPGSPRGCV